ncbi:MAG: hypothetical protein ABTQ32_40100 [Myxococcaceae bacterium]
MSTLRAALCLTACFLAVACGDTSQAPPPIDATWAPAVEGDAPSSMEEPAATDAGSNVEVCDGLDNDVDGAVDEDLDGQPCTLSGRRGMGTLTCEGGVPSCIQCTPGEARTASCGCNQQRHDVCGRDGAWILGTCDGCESTPQECTLCIPGERITRRCDSCPDGGDCGSNCVGSVWECEAGCRWKQITNCQALTPTCSGDMSIIEACGNCGTRRKSCDGCFWNSDVCTDQGQCKPGTSVQTPCFSKGCATGTVNRITCNAQCQWQVPTQCQGCTPGVTVTDVNCVTNQPQCGQMRVETTCRLSGQQAPICGGAQSLPIGTATTRVLTQCPPTQCTPGAGYNQPCTDAAGVAGTKRVTCKSDCTWDIPNTCTPGGTQCPTGQSCTPNAVTTTRKSCGPNTCGREYEETKTCTSTGCGASVTTTQVTACPACAAGQTRQIPCKTPGGACGTIAVQCNAQCTWDPAPAAGSTLAACVASPNSCVPGTTRIDYASCGANTCGRTYPRVMTCMASGCGYQFTSEDRSVCPTCTPDQTEQTQTLCRPGTPSCGLVQRKCNASTCQWQTLPCPVCG